MAVRIRADRKTIVCAAKSKVLPGDYYLDDNIHYILAVELRILHCSGKDDDGTDLWEFRLRRTGDWEEATIEDDKSYSLSS